MATNNNTILINGTAYWAHVQKPEEYSGSQIGYSIVVDLEDDEKLEKLQVHLANVFNEEAKEQGWKLDPKTTLNLPIKENTTANGETRECIKAKTKHEYQNKTTGEIVKRSVPIFDEYGEPAPKGTLIGNGSKVQINCTPHCYMINRKNFGVTLRLNAICVFELVEYSAGERNANSYGFSIKEKSESDQLNDGELEF